MHFLLSWYLPLPFYIVCLILNSFFFSCLPLPTPPMSSLINKASFLLLPVSQFSISPFSFLLPYSFFSFALYTYHILLVTDRLSCRIVLVTADCPGVAHLTMFSCSYFFFHSKPKASYFPDIFFFVYSEIQFSSFLCARWAAILLHV